MLNGPVADLFVVVARDLRAGRNGSVVVAIDARAQGLEVGTLTAMDLTRRYARLAFADAAPVAVLSEGSQADATVARGLQVAHAGRRHQQLHACGHLAAGEHARGRAQVLDAVGLRA